MSDETKRCIWCGARALPDGKDGHVWAVKWENADCEHETLEGEE